MSPDESPPPLPTFAPDEKVCGNCKLWIAHSVDHRGWVGPCRLQPSRGMFPPSAPICDAFAQRGVATPPRDEPERRARAPREVGPLVRRKADPGQAVELGTDVGGGPNMTRAELMDLFLEAAGYTEVALSPKWEGGTIQIVPGKADAQAKELPIDALLHKVVMVRNNLRTLEQKINAHTKLSEADKVELQAYITRSYGSLTTFNALFRDKADHFVGQKTDDDKPGQS